VEGKLYLQIVNCCDYFGKCLRVIGSEAAAELQTSVNESAIHKVKSYICLHKYLRSKSCDSKNCEYL